MTSSRGSGTKTRQTNRQNKTYTCIMMNTNIFFVCLVVEIKLSKMFPNHVLSNDHFALTKYRILDIENRTPDNKTVLKIKLLMNIVIS